MKNTAIIEENSIKITTENNSVARQIFNIISATLLLCNVADINFIRFLLNNLKKQHKYYIIYTNLKKMIFEKW